MTSCIPLGGSGGLTKETFTYGRWPLFQTHQEAELQQPFFFIWLCVCFDLLTSHHRIWSFCCLRRRSLRLKILLRFKHLHFALSRSRLSCQFNSDDVERRLLTRLMTHSLFLSSSSNPSIVLDAIVSFFSSSSGCRQVVEEREREGGRRVTDRYRPAIDPFAPSL